ncbi:ABC transporter permease [Kiloniella spongiae]|uniref:ABC transporter permease n=1 Tax=Kiloniella spongiae TaxID=1489064 RepID=A0A0H2MEM6_9PROT|nr:DMT family transporter [Kiloniella spongiae]KLN59167.1 ABC transporter permease [Kiloniella spongiae]
MNTSIKTSMGISEWIMLIILSILWGGSFFFVGVAVSELPPFTIVTIRVGFAAVALWAVIFSLKMSLPTTIKAWKALLIMGLLNNVIPFTLIVWGQIYIPSGLASILNATTPLFGVIVAALFLPDEKATALKVVGVIVGFFGVVLMFGLPDDNQNFLAQLAILGATLTYAFAGVFGRRFKAMAINPIVTAAGQVTGATVLLVPITYMIEGVPSLQTVSNETWMSLIALALLSTAVAYILYFKILERAGATNLLLVTLLVPVSAILLGALFLNEKLDISHFIGMAFIAIGLSAIDGRLWKKFRK